MIPDKVSILGLVYSVERGLADANVQIFKQIRESEQL